VGTFDMGVARAALRRSPLFSGIEEADVERCCEALRHRHFRRGETIFHVDDPGDTLHIVVSGAVLVEVPSPEGGEPAILATLGAGDCFGELALLDGAPRSATVVAVEPTETLVLARSLFEELVESSPTLRRALFASLAAEVRRLTGRIEDLHFLGLGERLASRILEEAEAADPERRSDVQLPWPYTQAELAGMIGGSRESVNRLLGELAAQGIVRIERDRLVIADLDRLAEAAGR
jgi:CRP/FNR family cyclic AMP-dependent transcriptional regulator